MFFINETDTIGVIMGAAADATTGNMVATLYVILFLCFALAFMFEIPLEFFAVIVFPLCLGMAAYYGEMITPIVVLVFYLAAIIAKHWLFK